MDIRCEVANDLAFLRISGRVDTVTAPELEAAVYGAIGQGGVSVVFDLGQVDYLSSSAFRVFIKTQKECRKNDGQAIIQAANPLIMPLFKLSGFDRLFLFTDSDAASRAAI